jgi:hypothetical protein
MDDLLELDEQILTFAIPDEVLERAAATEQQAVTWIYCTHAWNCREGIKSRPIERVRYTRSHGRDKRH